MPPTAACLGELLPFGDVAAALRAQRDLTPVTPEMVVADGAALAGPPGGPGLPAVTPGGGRSTAQAPPGPGACWRPTRAR